MSGKKKSKPFEEIINDLRYEKRTITVVCTAEQRQMLEKQIAMISSFIFTDRRRWATTYYIANNSRVILMHEKLLTPVCTIPINYDIRKWTNKKVVKYFTSAHLRKR